MDHFIQRNGVLHCEDVPLTELAAQVGTPAYVYSRATLRRHCEKLLSAFEGYPTLACFAVKSNSNLSVLQEIFACGLGADLVSLGELERALLAGVHPGEIVFSGVGKRRDEIEAAVAAGILSFNVESPYELDLISEVARARGTVAPLSLRVNPNIDAKTNEKIATGLYTTKFGLPEGELGPILERIKGDTHLRLIGLACHIGSQITSLGPIGEAVARMTKLAMDIKAQGFPLTLVNMGGGLGIRYRDETPPSLEDYAKTLLTAVKPTGLTLVIEPGRVLVGNVGVLLSRVIGVKKTPARHFVVLDAAMNDLVRPTLYDAWHGIEPAVVPAAGTREELCDFVGPICETGDVIGTGRTLSLPKAGDLYVVKSCGAYGASMASQYNSRPRAPEVMVDGASWRIVRQRETLPQLWAGELDALRKS